MTKESCMRRRRSTPPPPIPGQVRSFAGDRRATRRRQVQMEVVVHPLLDAERRPWISTQRRGICRDLSEHGMLVGRAGYLPVNSTVRLFFRLPGGGEISCHGVVVRHELWGSPRYGIKFFGLCPPDALRIQRLLG
jgi:hypothetical protein